MAPDLSEVLWERPAPAESDWTSWRPYVRGDYALAGTRSGDVCRIHLESGELETIWRMEGTVRVFTQREDVLYAGTAKGGLVALW